MKKGLTLTELLVSTILIGIVMTGVAAFSVFVKQARDSTGAGTILAVQTATAMHYMAADANKAVGDSSEPDGRGVVSSVGQESVCFRHDTNDPAVYTDDTWACYWYDAASDALWKCADRTAVAGAPPDDFADCQAGAGEVKLVTLDPDPGPPVAAQYFSVVNDADGRFAYIDITLNTIADPDQAASTIANPTQQLSTRVSPPAHGR